MPTIFRLGSTCSARDWLGLLGSRLARPARLAAKIPLLEAIRLGPWLGREGYGRVHKQFFFSFYFYRHSVGKVGNVDNQKEVVV